MAAACVTEVIAFEPLCSGRVRLTQEHLDSAAGDSEAEKRDDVLAEARIGCSQKCGCLEAFATFVDGPDGEFVEAQCRQDPGELALGRRAAPDPGRTP